MTFIDTADVYGDGRSEQIVGSFVKQSDNPAPARGHEDGAPGRPGAGNYTLDNFRAWTDRSRANLGVDTLELVQLHCPPTAVYAATRVFDALDTLVAEKRIEAYGVSVEKVDGGAGRHRPPRHGERADHPERVPAQAARAGAAGRARPPASGSSPACRWPAGCCPGVTTSTRRFAADDHRNFNRHGEAFDVGETFSGVDFEIGLEAVRRLAPLVPDGRDDGAVRAALRARPAGRLGRHPGRAQPGAGPRRTRPPRGLAPLTAATLAAIDEVYDELIRPQVHGRW